MAIKEDRAREGKKAQYRKMGLGPMMKSGEIDFGDKHPLLKAKKEKQKNYQNPKKDERFNAAFRARMKKAGLKDSEIGDTRLKTGGLSGGQKKIAAKAPPTNKIDGKDFAVLRAEKAKGRGMGLQDEKVKPGKVMKAKRGQFSKSSSGTTAKSAIGKTFSGYSKVFKTGVSAGDKAKATSTIIGVKPKLPKPSKESSIARRALRGVQATSLGKKLLPVVAAGVAAQQYLKSKMKKKKEEPKKKMGGGMMKRPMGYTKGGGADTGTEGEFRSSVGVVENKLRRYRDSLKKKLLKTGPGTGIPTSADMKKIKERLSPENLKQAGKTGAVKLVERSMKILKDNKKMNGGMMKRPMGYSSGTPKGGVPDLPSFLKDEKGNPIPRKRKGPKRSGNSKGSVRQKQDFVGMMGGGTMKVPGYASGTPKGGRMPDSVKRAGLGAGVGALGGSGRKSETINLMKNKIYKYKAKKDSGFTDKQVSMQKDIQEKSYKRKSGEKRLGKIYSASPTVLSKAGITGSKRAGMPGHSIMTTSSKGKTKLNYARPYGGTIETGFKGYDERTPGVGLKTGKSIKVKCKLGKNKPTKMY